MSYFTQRANYAYNLGKIMTRAQTQPLLDIKGSITQIVQTAGLRIEVIVTPQGNWAFECNGGSLMMPAPYAENWADEGESA
jgi:hypothetical protein